MHDASGNPPRTGRDLFRATEPFAKESRPQSWLHLGSSTVLLGGALVVAALAQWWPLRVVAGGLGALLMVRAFVMCHDFMHGATLRGSWLAKATVYSLGVLLLTPPGSWRRGHNYHHGHVGQQEASNVGSFPILTTDMWHAASASQRLVYRFSRHPLAIVCAYVTVFLYSICLQSLWENPRRHWDSGLALAVHGGVIALLWIFAGPAVMLCAFLLPLVLASILGAYLFYAQHNFAGVRVLTPDEWSYSRGALESSSYMKLGPIMRRFTGNIGYHHVHHLNPLIPSYRLPEAMAAIPELQRPIVTTLRPRDIYACLRLKLWDPERQQMVGFREARAMSMSR